MSIGFNGFFFLCGEEQKNIDKFLSGFENDVFADGEYIPKELSVPDSRVCDYMVHVLCKEYGYSIENAWLLYELDYVRLKAFETLEGKQQKYLIDNK